MKNIMKAYAARAYTILNPRKTNYIEVNVPEYVPTLPKDNNIVNMTVSGSYFVNTNYPITQGRVITTHAIELPLARGTNCPTLFDKGTTFLLLIPNTKIEEGYLIYL